MNKTLTLTETLALAEVNANLDGAMDAEAYDVYLSLVELMKEEQAAEAAEVAWIERCEAEHYYATA